MECDITGCIPGAVTGSGAAQSRRSPGWTCRAGVRHSSQSFYQCMVQVGHIFYQCLYCFSCHDLADFLYGYLWLPDILRTAIVYIMIIRARHNTIFCIRISPRIWTKNIKHRYNVEVSLWHNLLWVWDAATKRPSVASTWIKCPIVISPKCWKNLW